MRKRKFASEIYWPLVISIFANHNMHIASEIFRPLKSNEVINEKNSKVEICQRFSLIYKATFSGFSKVNTQTKIHIYLHRKCIFHGKLKICQPFSIRKKPVKSHSWSFKITRACVLLTKKKSDEEVK